MDANNKATKEEELQFWQERLEQIEGRSGVTINIGTEGGQVHDSDISINEINTAKAQIARIKAEMKGEEPIRSGNGYAGLFAMITFIANKQDRVEQGIMTNAELIYALQRQVSMTIRERASIYIANVIWLVAIGLIFIKETRDYGISNPLHGTLIIVLLALAGLTVRWLAGEDER
jgi:hypothetical protein